MAKGGTGVTMLAARADEEVWSLIETFTNRMAALKIAPANLEPVMYDPVYLGQYLIPYRTTLASMNRCFKIAPQVELLDWGAGYGHGALVVSGRGRSVAAYSLKGNAAPYSDILESLASVFEIDVKLGEDPVQIPFPNESIGTVVGHGVLEHVHEGGGDALQSLREINRILVPGGAFVCGHLPSRHSIIEWIHRIRNTSHHSRTFTKAEIVSLLQQAQFDVTLIRYYGAVPRNRIAIRSQRTGSSSTRTAKALAMLDKFMSMLLQRYCQNLLIVAEKPCDM
jgi:SAM-dependent methyltransferase